MTEDRLKDIAFQMETPLIRLRGVEETLLKLLEGAQSEEQAAIHSLLVRNLLPELKEVRDLWEEVFTLTVKSKEKPPLNAA